LDLPDKLGRYGRSCFSPSRGQPGQPVTVGRSTRASDFAVSPSQFGSHSVLGGGLSVFQAQHDSGCQETWTLALLAQVAHEQGLSTTVLSQETIRRALRRLEVGWKRAKRWLTSPDPAYAPKKAAAIV
jgi:hypothetical protein